MGEDARHLLRVDALVTGYGTNQILNGVTLDVAPAEIVALIGHNGAGKSTLLKAVFGMLPIWSGNVALDGRRLDRPTPRDLLRAKVAYVPQGGRVFADLTVRENLEMGAVTLPRGKGVREGVGRVFSLFPALRSRLRQRAGTLSGGEKQMLALANALILSPRLLLLDEPSLGLAPPLVTQAMQRIREISLDSGTAFLIVEQKVRDVLKIARRAYVLRNGNVSYSCFTDSLNDEVKLRAVYL